MKILTIIIGLLVVFLLVAEEYSIDTISSTILDDSVLWEKLSQQDNLVYQKGSLFSG